MATQPDAAVERFQAGQAYFGRYIGDADHVFRYLVVRRTASTVWLRDLAFPDSPVRARRVSVYQGVETALPAGGYSMCPVLRADRVVLVTGGV